MADNTAYTEYLAQCVKNLKASASEDLASFEKVTTKYYSDNNWKMTLMGQGEHADYKQSDEFSLDGITKAIKGIVDGFFGTEKLPAGSTKTGDASKLPTLLAGGEKALILQAAMTLVTNLLEIFSSKTELTYTCTSNHAIILPGLTLHIFVMNAGYQSTNYFGGHSIEENIFVYKLIWSAEQEKTMGTKTVMDAYTAQLNKLIDSMEKKQNQFDDEIAREDPDLGKLKKMQDAIDFMLQQIARFRTLLNGVTTNSLMPVRV